METANSTGTSGMTPLDPSDNRGPAISPSAGYRSADLMLRYLHSDGFQLGGVQISGVRVYDSHLNAWTTPDAYEGSIHDPASQMPYMWNRNNPYQYSDPSGYCPACAVAPELVVGGAFALAAVAAVSGNQGLHDSSMALGNAVQGKINQAVARTVDFFARNSANKIPASGTPNSMDHRPDPHDPKKSKTGFYDGDGKLESELHQGHEHNGMDPHVHDSRTFTNPYTGKSFFKLKAGTRAPNTNEIDAATNAPSGISPKPF